MDKPDTITVNIELEQKVYASRADMYVEIKGDSFFSGNAALEKALEVRALVVVLAGVRIEESHIQVVGITAEVSSGIIGRSSSAVYRLRIEVASLDMLADALGAVTSSKNASLTLLDWQYDGIEELHAKMLRQALRSAELRAALICRELNHTNLGVHSCTERLRDDQEKQLDMPQEFLGGVRRRAAVTKENLGLDVTHAKTVSLDVRVEYRVQPEPKAEQTAAADG